MIIRRQSRKNLPAVRFISIFCLLAVLLSTSWALSTETRLNSLSPSCPVTEKQFEKKVGEYLGVPYRRGGTSKDGMDCSGFVRTLYDELFNIELPHSSRGQYQFSALRQIPKIKMQAGDLLFFSDKKKKRVNHVGVYLSGGRFIHASSSQGITVSRLSESYWRKRFVSSKHHPALHNSPAGLGSSKTDHRTRPSVGVRR